MENETGKDRQAALADMRFSFINRVCDNTVINIFEKVNLTNVALNR